MFNPNMKKIIRLHNLKGPEWDILDPKCHMSIFVKQPDLLNKPVGFAWWQKICPPVTIYKKPTSTLIPDNEDSDTKAGRMDASGEDASASKLDEAIKNEPRTEAVGFFVQSKWNGEAADHWEWWGWKWNRQGSSFSVPNWVRTQSSRNN
jgi:hypothetical protein